MVLGIAALLLVSDPTGFQPLGAPAVDLGAPVPAPAQVLDESAPVRAAPGQAGPEVPVAPSSPGPETPVAPVAPVVPAPTPEPRPALLVFNNSRTGDLGERAAAGLREGGWRVRDVGSLRGRFRTSTVYFEPGQRAAAEQLAEQYGVPRVLPRLDALPGSGMTVVVTRDWDS